MAEQSLKLYLDNQRPAPPGWQLVRTVDQAKPFIRSGRVSQLSVDYDLDNDHKGMELLTWMRDHKKHSEYAPKVHSGNAVGALKMKAFIAEHFNHLPAAPAAKRGRPKGSARPGGHYPRAMARPSQY